MLKPKVEIPAGWRLLVKNEKIKIGDKIRSFLHSNWWVNVEAGGLVWEPGVQPVIRKVDPHLNFRICCRHFLIPPFDFGIYNSHWVDKWTVYIAGPMRGIQYYNFPAFDRASNSIATCGDQPVSPADLDRQAGFNAMALPFDWDWNKIPEGIDFDACVTRDIAAVRSCDCVYVLPGWEKSTGARAEVAIAEWLGKPIEGRG